jgi:hypothetical protein
MVCHLAVRVNNKIKALTHTPYFRKPDKSVLAIDENALTSIASASDVIERAWKFKS